MLIIRWSTMKYIYLHNHKKMGQMITQNPIYCIKDNGDNIYLILDTQSTDNTWQAFYILWNYSE